MAYLISILFTLLILNQYTRIESFTIPANVTSEFIDTIPYEDRGNFIIYEVMLAVNRYGRSDIFFIANDDLETLKSTLKQKFGHIVVPDDFRAKLLYWIENDIKINGHLPIAADEANEIRTTICFPQGCVDPGDIGQICCPFDKTRAPSE